MLEYDSGYLGILEILKAGYVQPIFRPAVKVDINLSRSQNFYLIYEDIIEHIDMHGNYFRDTKKGNDKMPYGDTISSLQSLNLLETNTNSQIKEFLRERIDRSIIWLYIVLHNFTGATVKISKKDESINVLIMKDSLKSSKARFTEIKKIEESIQFILLNRNPSIVELVLFCGKYCLESLLICAITKKDQYFIDLIKIIINSGKCDCYKIVPIVRGGNFKDTDIKCEELKKALHGCLVYQIENPDASKEDILDSYKR